MNIKETFQQIYFFAASQKAISLEDLLDFTGPCLDAEVIKEVLLNDPRIIFLGSKSSKKEPFILDSVLFRWLCQLNYKLARIRQFRLAENQIISLFNMFIEGKHFDYIPGEVIRWGYSLGLICPSFSERHYIFPFAKILSNMKSGLIYMVSEILKNFFIDQLWNQNLLDKSTISIENGFYLYSDEITFIIKNRNFLINNKKKTLQELANTYNLTRERIRQLENSFWDSLKIGYRHIRPFLEAFIYGFMGMSGRQVIEIDSLTAPIIKFLSNCIGIPHAELPWFGLMIIGSSMKEIHSLESISFFPDLVDTESIERDLGQNRQIVFSKIDIQLIAIKIAQFLRKQLKVTQKTYLALRSIGRPAHFSEITEFYNSLWPEYPLNEQRIQAALGKQKHGIVWIGMDGTYALKEWGYERPSMDIIQTVGKIVRDIYKKTKNPVSEVAIRTELGKYRKLVKPSSLAMALHFNPGVRCIKKIYFIPEEKHEKSNEEISLEELDKKFKEFKERS